MATLLCTHCRRGGCSHARKHCRCRPHRHCRPCRRPGCACPCHGNLLKNPSFDDLTPTKPLVDPLPAHWSTHFSSADIVRPTSFGDVHSGAGSVVFHFTGGRTEGDIFQDVPASANCCYTLDLWAKGTPTSGDLTASIAYLDAFGSVLRVDIVTVDRRSLSWNAWTVYRVSGTPAPHGTSKIRVTVHVRGSGKSLRLDDVYLTVAGCGGKDP